MLKEYVKLFIEAGFANQSQSFSSVLKDIDSQNAIARKDKKVKDLNDKDLKNKEIDFETYSFLLNRGIPRGQQFTSAAPKKRQ